MQNRPWLKKSQAAPQPASIWMLLFFYALAAGAFGGCAALLFAHSLRDIHLARVAGAPGASLTVEWRFSGHRFWQRHWPQIMSVEAREIRVPRPYDGTSPTFDVVTQCVFQDAHQHDVIIFRNSSHHGHVGEMQAWLAATPGDPGELTIHEDTRWFSTEPLMNMFWCVVALIIGTLLGTLLLIGALSATWVRLTAKKR